MASMSFSGISSGLPTDQLIQAILSNESLPLTRLQNRQSQNALKKTALQSIKTALTSLSTSISSLNSSKLDARKVTSSDASFVSATATKAKSGSYDITVDQLASKARLEMNTTFSGTDNVVGRAGDVFTLKNKDDQEVNITLDGDTTLAQLSDKINAAKIVGQDGKEVAFGVTSNVVQTTPGQYKLVLSATDTGAGTISFSAAAGSSNSPGSLTEDSFNPPDLGEGQNAKFTIDGVAMERTTNTISDAVDGVTFTLNKKTDADKPINLAVKMDTESITKAFQDVVDKFNTAYQVYKNNSGATGSLANDSTMRTMFAQIKSSLSGAIEGAGGLLAGSAATLGMATKNDGTLTLDAKKLEEALEKNPDIVSKVFDKMSSAARTMVDSYTTYGGGAITSLINSIDTTNSTLAKQIDTLQGRLERRKEALTSQFAKMESLIGQMQSAGQALGGLY